METTNQLFQLAVGRELNSEESSAARWQLALRASLASSGLAALFGLAAGSANLQLALKNIYKVPMVLLLSGLFAIPAGAFVWKLLDEKNKTSELVLAIAAGNLNASIVLALFAPLIALYFHTSDHFGMPLALVAIVLALLGGIVVFCRSALRAANPFSSNWVVGVPLVVVLGMQLACALQLVQIASPILPSPTVFRGGIDGLIAMGVAQ